MLVKTLSLAGASFSSHRQYLEYLLNRLPTGEGQPYVLVLPAHAALRLAFSCKELERADSFLAAYGSFARLPRMWLDGYLDIHRQAAQKLCAYIVPGTMLQVEGNNLYHEACLIDPQGEVVGLQRQAFLSRQEREMGWSRGEDIEVFDTELGRLGIIIGTDAWYPEVGRVLSLKGAELVCHCGAIPAAENRWRQVAGMWQQVQQNQFFCAESQLVAQIAGENFSAESLIHAPCEMTPGFEGILAGGGLDGAPVEAVLDSNLRKEVIGGYPLMRLLNPAAYQDLYEEGL